MAKTGKTNLTSYSLEKASLPKGVAAGNKNTAYSSSKVLAKSSGSQGRASQYKLENFKK